MRRLIPALVLGMAMLAGCTNMPAVPLVSPSTATSTPGSPDTSAIAVAVDSITGGYNPHKIADQSTVTTALADMLLPSVFRTAADGTPELDRNLMVSAQVTNADPFTVTYSVRTDASWSDGTPIDAADFAYLRTQLSTQPGVVDAAGYRLISNIVARDNAKTIQVIFSRPYPGWRSLFTDLLPAHLLKDAPGGWAQALSDSFPASAGPFDIKKLDTGGGEIVLERSDRYWGKPSVLDQIILRKTGVTGTVDALRSGADQAALGWVAGSGVTQLASLGQSVSLSTVPTAELATVLLRPAGPTLADATVRAAVAATLDRGALIAAGTGGGPSAQYHADALVVPPSRAGYAATLPLGVPAVADPAAAGRLLTQAGYAKINGLWTRNGQPLRLVVAAPAGREPFVTIAEQVRQQLVAAGIQATLLTPTPSQLYDQQLVSTTSTSATGTGGATTSQGVDILVGPQPVGGDSPTVLASWFGCPTTPSGSSTPAPGSPLGLCDAQLQPTMQSALTGDTSLSDALATVEPALWAQNVEIPLFQVCEELVIGRNVSGVQTGPPFAGPFVSAAEWSRPAR